MPSRTDRENTPGSGNVAATTAEAMRAIVQHAYGSYDVLESARIERPTIGDDQVLVRVRAVGVDPSIWHRMTGHPYLIRLMGYGFRRPKTPVPGTDVAGVVEAVGAAVTRFAPGDEVLGAGPGGLAEYAAVREAQCEPKPAALSFEQAAALRVSGMTALQALRDKGELQAGQHVLVIGAAGGVGTFAVQIAKALGAQVTGVCSTTKLELVRSIGADHVIDYTREDLASAGRRYDLIVDTAGNRRLKVLRRLLTPEGTLVIVGGEEGGRWLAGTQRHLAAMVLSRFGRQRLRGIMASDNANDVRHLVELVEAGTLTPVLDRTYPLAQIADALRHLEAGGARGKIVVTP